MIWCDVYVCSMIGSLSFRILFVGRFNDFVLLFKIPEGTLSYSYISLFQRTILCFWSTFYVNIVVLPVKTKVEKRANFQKIVDILSLFCLKQQL